MSRERTVRMKINREVINYLIFGLLTTAVSILSFQLFGYLLGEDAYLVNNILSWIISVSFAFVTNKLWVFESKEWSFLVLKSEITGFLAARLFSLLVEELGLFLLIGLLNVGKLDFEILGFLITGTLIAKVVMQIIVVLLNYFFSKFLIFKK